MSLAWLKVDVLLGSFGKLAAASLLFATLGITGCGDDPVKAGVAKGCTLNSDCNGSLVCSFGLCHQECEVSEDCPSNQRCVKTEESNVCQLNDEAKCHFKSDCEDPLVCAIDLQCRNQCQESKDCLKGQSCADGVCADPDEVTDEGGLKGAVGSGGEGGGGSGGSGGGPTTPTCTPGAECVPEGEPCQVGSITCEDGKEVCVAANPADDGTECGTDQVCDEGSCVACKAGEACQPTADNACIAGQISCATGPSCEVSGDVANGTGCGTDQVCSSGACVGCVVGEACSPPGAPCREGALACSNGPVCTPGAAKAAGASCATDKVCDSVGACKDCVQDAACEPDGTECHVGKQDCASGPNCVDTLLASADGTSCTGGAAYNFCTGGNCVACQNGNACIPAGDLCHKGTLNCGTTPPTCNASQTNAVDGLACGDNQSCISGSCVTNDRVLTVTSGAVPDVAIDAPFAPVTVHLVDANNKVVQGAAVVVTPAPGAYGVGSAATNASGNSQITGRVGRAIGSYKFTVSAPGATSIDFTVKAVAPTAGNIFTLVNVNHLSGTSTVPGAGTISKLYYEARAVASATDGTLYIASYCAVFKLTPSGVLTRIAGDANESCGFTGDSGVGSSARVYNVSGLALDETNGFLYLADTSNQRVRQIELASGNILTFAGGGETNVAPWGDGGPADGAYLSPSNVAVAPNGDVYISDSNASRIRKVDYASGVITTAIANVACNANNALSLNYCGGYGDACSVAWDSAGKMFISGHLCGGGLSGFRGVARVESDGSLSQVAGTTGAANPAEGGTATSAAFTYSPYMTFDKAGNLYLATRYDHRIRKIDSVSSKITTVAGTGTAAYSGEYVAGNTAELSSPTTLSFDGAGNLYFADSGNYAVRGLYGLGASTVPTATLASTGGTGQTVKRNAPFGALTVKLTDSANANIAGASVQWKRLETGAGLGATGVPSTVGKTNASGVSAMTGRVGLASGDYHLEASFTDIHGNAVTGSPQTFTITAADPDAGTIFPVVNYVHTSGTGGYPGPAVFAKLQTYSLGVVAASDGTFYVTDSCAVYKVTVRGEASVFAGTPGSCTFSGDSGPALGAKLYYPEGMALDETRKVLYIADSGNVRVRAVSLETGVITTLAGGDAVNTEPYGDGGQGTDANLGSVYTVALDPNGLVYVPDYNHNRIRVINPDTGIISTWLLGNTTCTAGTVSLRSVSQYGALRFAANGTAYIGSYICNGTDTTYALGVAARATNNTMTRIAGLSTGITTENADALMTSLPDLTDILIDGNGDLVLAMYGNHRVRRINMTTGKINTIAGDGTAGYAQPTDVSVDPGAYVPSTSVRVYNPWKLALWPGGHILIADEYTYSTRMIW